MYAALGSVALVAAAILGAVLIGTRRRMAYGGQRSLRYAFATKTLTVALTASSVTITLPSAVIPKSLRIAANGNATAQLLIDNVNSVTVDSQPGGNPMELPIPPGAFPEPVTSLAVLVTSPATAGGQATLSIGY